MPQDQPGSTNRLISSIAYTPRIIPALLIVAALIASCADPVDQRAEADSIREIERDRLRSLVEADMEVARRLHVDEFQLITPSGNEYSKESYLGDIESGVLDYRVWAPGEITVRLYDDVAVLRYEDIGFQVYAQGQLAWSGVLRHTNLYERTNGQWQIVWSHASGGSAP